jgi:16S rRNA (cytosine967-C5)-methyltransferase
LKNAARLAKPSPARSAAFDILLRVERESSYASELLHSSNYEQLSSRDHALATELVMGVLRWRSRLDDEISRASSQKLAKLDLEILTALRLAVYQFRFLRIPARAALHESVELVKRARKRSAAPFVNAVLRKLSVQPIREPNPQGMQELEPAPQSLATTWAHPLWLLERWADEYGLAAARQICDHDQSTPATTIRLRSPDAENELTTEGIQLLPGALMTSARRVQSGDVTKTRAYREARVAIQDEASQLVALLIGRGSHILDCCAAPGGKTLAIADHNPVSNITAVELHPHRARLLQKLLNANPRTTVIAADARHLPLAHPFDRILADVPCSGTGTLARNPEIKWRLNPDDLADLHARQVAILSSALAHLHPGGRLVYSTCSLEKAENEDVVEQILSKTKSLHVLDCREELERLHAAAELAWPDPSSLTRGPYLRTIPGVHPCDGFFAAILEKKS